MQQLSPVPPAYLPGAAEHPVASLLLTSGTLTPLLPAAPPIELVRPPHHRSLRSLLLGDFGIL
ncbi:MAG TPA: hypothetical protein VFL95_11500, partial [Gemmatimonadales bacterium]|nr:hypothetical protein [Gemmatimonadales bacterium]